MPGGSWSARSSRSSAGSSSSTRTSQALPLPTAIANVYQGVLPTYLYAFQFPVNTVAATVPIQLLGPVPLLLGASIAVPALVVGYSAWVWRLALAERRGRGARSAPSSGRAAAGAGGGDGRRLRPGSVEGARSSASDRGRRRRRDRLPAAPAWRRSEARGDGGIGAWKPAGSSPRAASRRMTKP